MKEVNHPINSIWYHFQTSLEKSIKRNAPIKNTRKKDGCPWITSDIKRLIRRRHRWYKRSRKSGHSGDNKKFKDLKRPAQKEIRRAYWKYIDGIMSSETESDLETGKRSNTMKRFWTFTKHNRSDGKQIPPLKSEGLLHSEPIEKANILNNQFQNAFYKMTHISRKNSPTAVRCKVRHQR